MSELIKRQDAINAIIQNYCYESDRLTALQELATTTEEKIKTDAIMNYSVAVLAEVAESARQEDAPIYEGDKEVDRWVRLSDVEDAINRLANYEDAEEQGFADCAKDLDKIKRSAFMSGIEAAKGIEWTKESEEIERVLKECGY